MQEGIVTMSIIGKRVIHEAFGSGTIETMSENVIDVRFDQNPGETKRFFYPACFDRFLTMADQSADTEYDLAESENDYDDGEWPTLFERLKKEESIRYNIRLTAAQLKEIFGVSGKYCMTHSAFDQTTFLFTGVSVGGDTITKLTESGTVTVETQLHTHRTYENELLPEETELSDTPFIIERINENRFIFRGVADLNEIKIVKKTRNASGEWYLDCIFLGKLRNEKDAYTFKTVDTDTLETTVYIPIPEGTKKAVYTTKYERKKSNRDAAIAAHGTVCMACGFDFEKTYGKYGKGFIEVHHTKPLFENEEEIIPDPETDLICLCSNCHRMIHHFKNKVLTLNKLKQIIKEAGKS